MKSVLLGFTIFSLSNAFSEVVITSSEKLTEDKTFSLTDDTLYFEGAKVNANGKNVVFDGSSQYALIFDLNQKQSDGLVVDGATLAFNNLSRLEVKDTLQSAPTPTSWTFIFRSSGKKISCSNIDQIYLHDNYYKGESSFFFVRNGVAGTVAASFENIREIRMENNRQKHENGADAGLAGFFVSVQQYGDIVFNNIEKIYMANNVVGKSAYGGLIYAMGGKVEWSNIDEITIKDMSLINSGNYYSGCLGGAIYAAFGLSISQCGDILFEDVTISRTNKNTIPLFDVVGGAIFVGESLNYYYSDKEYVVKIPAVLFSADYGDITFKGNRSIDMGVELLDSVYILGASELTIRAQEGRTVSFYDKITTNSVEQIVFNADVDGNPASYTGTVIFSGKYLNDYIIQGKNDESEDEAAFNERRWGSRYSYLSGSVDVKQGTFILEHEAAIGMAPTTWKADQSTSENIQNLAADSELLVFEKDTYLNLDCPLFRIVKEGMLMGPTLNIKGTENVFQTDGSGVFVGGVVDFSQGVSYDFDFTLPSAQSGITIASTDLRLGGDFKVADTSSSYLNEFWAHDREFLVLRDVNQSREGSDFDRILSTVADSAEVRDPHRYQGDWSMRWDDDDLYAVWSMKSTIIDVDPEMKSTGSLVESSLWVTLSNMKALSDASARQIDFQRYLEGPCRHVWVSALGDFMNQDSNGETNGFMYNGYGVAVGMDSIGCKHFVGGLSLGYMHGKMNTRREDGSSDMDSFMATLYGGYRDSISDVLDFYWVNSLSLGQTANKSHSIFEGKESAWGSWNNYGILLESTLRWNYAMTPTSFLSPHFGLEYAYEKRESFDETGAVNWARHFDDADLGNLRLPVGLAFTKLNQISASKFWTNTFDVSVLFDVYRSNPESSAHALVNDIQWRVDAANPAREALRLSWNSFFKLDEHWGLFGGYNVELRENAVYQQGNLGLSYSF